MSYVIAAYGITAVALGLYGLHLSRERHRLRSSAEGRPYAGSG